MSAPGQGNPFERLRELCLRIPEGAQELLPVIDFLEAFPAARKAAGLFVRLGSRLSARVGAAPLHW